MKTAAKRDLSLRLLAAGLAVVLLALVLSCFSPVREWGMAGTWESDGSYSIAGMNTPLNGAESLTLHLDGTGSVKKADGDIVPFEWSLVNMTLNLQTMNACYGVAFAKVGPVLDIADDSGMIRFSRA